MSSTASPRAEARTILVIVAIVQFVIGGWFSWSASRAEPRDVPVLVVAAQGADQLTDRLREAAPGAYEIKSAAGRGGGRRRAARPRGLRRVPAHRRMGSNCTSPRPPRPPSHRR